MNRYERYRIRMRKRKLHEAIDFIRMVCAEVLTGATFAFGLLCVLPVLCLLV